MSRKNKNTINIEESLQTLWGYGLIPEVFNNYQFRIFHEEHKKFYDWYHTRGTLTVIHDGMTSRVTTLKDAGSVAEFIIKHLRV